MSGESRCAYLVEKSTNSGIVRCALEIGFKNVHRLYFFRLLRAQSLPARSSSGPAPGQAVVACAADQNFSKVRLRRRPRVTSAFIELSLKAPEQPQLGKRPTTATAATSPRTNHSLFISLCCWAARSFKYPHTYTAFVYHRLLEILVEFDTALRSSALWVRLALLQTQKTPNKNRFGLVENGMGTRLGGRSQGGARCLCVSFFCSCTRR